MFSLGLRGFSPGTLLPPTVQEHTVSGVRLIGEAKLPKV